MLLKQGKKRLLDEDEVAHRNHHHQQQGDLHGHGIAWFRGNMIGRGAFGSVYMANLKKPRSKYSFLPSVLAVKSAEVSLSTSIQKEREVFSNVCGCPNVITCFGDETTNGEDGQMVYNLLLEYASGGTLAQQIKKFGSNGLLESDVRKHTRSILLGLFHIHDCGYVHCDLKPENILLVPNANGFRAKIGDLGLAKRENHQSKRRKLDPHIRGTPMYLAPEVVSENVQDFPSDIWALGCIVLEMFTGKKPWNGVNSQDILRQIGQANELPQIPTEISKEGRSFLKACFVRNPMFRFTTEMLLNHQFMAGLIDDDDDVEELDAGSTLLSGSGSGSGSDDELSGSEDWSFLPEEESFSCWSEEEQIEEEDSNSQVVSTSPQEEILQVKQGTGVTSSCHDAGFHLVTKPSTQVSSHI